MSARGLSNTSKSTRYQCRVAAFVVVFALVLVVVDGLKLVPAVMLFGDSVVDVGNNNNNVLSLVKANFLPYGRDFPGHFPTGRFCNGKLATDFTVESLGFTRYPPAYLSHQATGQNLLLGANFASGASGYWETTASLYSAVSLTQQLENYKHYQSKVLNITGEKKANRIFSRAIYMVSAGASDYVQNYYINPMFFGVYTPAQFADILVQRLTSFVQNLYSLGARRIGVTSLPPMGCLPAAITLFGGGNNSCVARLNEDSVTFNKKVVGAAQGLRKKLPGLKLVLLDIYKPLYDMVQNPAANGFTEARRACCGTGTIETSLLCNAATPGTCQNATSYVFWDSFHPTEAANRLLANEIMLQGIKLIS